ncbi:hypothetical protein Cflav_PD2368, partial [Pedosphaera parvula Ellin514]
MKKMLFGVMRKLGALTGQKVVMIVSAVIALGGVTARADYTSTVLADSP